MTAPLQTYKDGQAAVASGTGALDLLPMGDSVVEGLGVDVEGRWVTKLRNYQRARWQPAAVPGGAGYIPSNYFAGGVTNPWVYSGGTPNLSNQYGLGHRHHHWGSGSITQSLTFTGTRIRVMWAGSTNTGIIGISIDGGAAVSVNTATGFTSSTPTGGGSWLSPVLSAGQHTITMTNTSGKTVLLSGAAVYNGDDTRGIRLWEAGHSGWEAEDYANLSPNNTAHAATVTAIGPHLIILALGYNDARNGRTAAQFQTDLGKIIDDTRAAGASPSFLIVGYPRCAGVTEDLWTQYLAAMSSVATAKNAVFLNLSVKPITFQSDAVHPDANGHTVIAQEIDTYLAAQIAPPSVTANITGSGSITASTRPTLPLDRIISGSGALTATARPLSFIDRIISGSGALTATVTVASPGIVSATITGTGALTATASVPRVTLSLTLTGQGTLTSATSQSGPQIINAAALEGTGRLTVAVAAARTTLPPLPDIQGSGVLEAQVIGPNEITVWVAERALFIGQGARIARAFNPGEIVPPSVAARNRARFGDGLGTRIIRR